MRLSTAYRYKFLKDYRIGVPELLSNVSYQGNIIFNESDLRKSIGWIPNFAFNQLGQSIIGEFPLDQFGYSVSVNGSGDRIIAGAVANDGNGSSSGHARVYQLSSNNDTTTWVQLGQDIDGELAVDRSGAVSMNNEGNIVAIGAQNNDGGGNLSGHVRVYQLSSNNSTNTWVQLGQDIDGEAIGDYSGGSVSLNFSGNIVAIGAQGNDGSGSMSGHVRVYQLSSNNSTNTWVQLGQDIDGEAPNDQSSRRISLNSAGDRVAVGAPYNINSNGVWSGHTRIYQLSANTWIKLGQDIDGEAAYDQCGYSVSMNSLGDRVAIGSPYNSDNESNSGQVRVYQLSAYNNVNTWIQLGQDINGVFSGNEIGSSVTLNSTGDIVGIGGAAELDLSQAQIYKLSSYNNIDTWVKFGDDINGQIGIGDIDVSISKSGERLVIGSQRADVNGNVRVIDLNLAYLDKPFTSFNDETISVTRPTWKYYNNLNIVGGWYNSVENKFVTNLFSLSLSAGVDSDKFTSQNVYKGYKWVEVASKKNTNISLSASQDTAIYFKLTGFQPRLIAAPKISWTYNSKIISGSDIYNNIFKNVVPNFTTLSSTDIDGVFINYTPEIQALSTRHVWNINGFDKYFEKNAQLIDYDGAGPVVYYLSAYSYKNTYPITTNTETVSEFNQNTLYTASTGFFDFANKSTQSLGSRLSSVPRLSSTMNLFTSKNATSNIFTRNSAVWCADLTNQLTSLVVYRGTPNPAAIYSYGGTLITPRHVLYVQHAFPKTNRLRFVTSNNVVISANQLAGADSTTYGNDLPILSLSGVDPLYTDIGVTVLDRDVSLSGIYVMPVAAITPAERTIIRQQYIPTLLCSQGVGRATSEPNPNPLSGSDIQMTINSTNFGTMTTAWGSNSANPFYVWDTNSSNAGYTLWDGDSGNSHLLFCNDKLYVYSLTRYPSGDGPIVSALSGAINYLIEKADQLAGINTGLKPTYYTIDQIANR